MQKPKQKRKYGGVNMDKVWMDKVWVDDLETPATACILSIGDRYTIGGGEFRVVAIGRKFIRLQALPGTVVSRG